MVGEKLKTSTLKSISICCKAASPPAVAKCLQALIANNARLEELDSWDQPGTDPHILDFAAVVGDTPCSADFRPSLRALRAGNLQISASPNVLKYLTNLTSLCISNLHADHDTLWPAFHLRGIALKSLTIERPTERLTDYLLEYRGLERLVLARQDPGNRVHVGVTTDTKIRFLEKGVAHHCESLAHIEIMFYPHNMSYRGIQSHGHLILWGLDERQIVWLERFPKLSTLAVPFVHDGKEAPKGTKISMVRD